MGKQIIKRFRSEKKAVTSLWLGIFSGGLLILMMLIGGLAAEHIGPPMFLLQIPFLVLFIFLFIIFAGIIGIVLGVLGLKSTKKNFAIAGIILCLVGLLAPLYYFFK